MKKLSKLQVSSFINIALKEDRAWEDVTTNSLVDSQHVSEASILIKEKAVICGLEFVRNVFETLDKRIKFSADFSDGDEIEANTRIAFIKGKTRGLLAAERTALNFLSYLCGIATTTDQFVKAVRPFKAHILDTRKTTPGLRALEKYAVQCGGGHNHRFDLNAMVLVKDNHREACAPQVSIAQAIECLKRKTRKKIEIEVDTLDQFEQALAACPDIILLDNMSLKQMKMAVNIAKHARCQKSILLEASGGVTLKRVNAIAKTGVDRISIGSLTHTHRAIDVSMELGKNNFLNF